MGVWVAAAALLLLQLGCSSLVAADTRGTIIVDAGRELCFYEQLTLGMPFVIDYRVFFGGNNDINFRMRDPQRNIISNGNKQTAETVQGHATMPGEHEICFNNKFSTVSFKKVFFSLTLGDEKLAFMDSIHVMTMGPFDTSVLNIHTRLESIITEQQFHSSTEAYDRDLAVAMNERVHIWSFAEAVVLILLSVAQVVYLRGFFSDSEERLRDRLLLAWLAVVFGGISWVVFYTPWVTDIRHYF